MAYDPIEPGAAPMLPTYIVLTVFCCFMTILLFIRWRQRNKRAPFLLFLTFLTYTLCITVLMAGFADAMISGYKRELYRFSLAFGYAGIMVANCFLLYFAADIFGIKHELLKKYIICSLIIAVAVALPWNYYGVPDAEINKSLYIRPFTSISMVIFSILTYSKIYGQAMRVHAMVDERVAKIGFRLIAYSQIFMIMLFVFLFVDVVVFALTDLKGYTIFTYLGWACAGLFMIFSYLGLIMPKWLRSRFEDISA